MEPDIIDIHLNKSNSEIFSCFFFPTEFLNIYLYSNFSDLLLPSTIIEISNVYV